MSSEQATILGILGLTITVFVWGRWRHDVVALGALLAATLAGLVAPDAVFAGFGHPAVITVAGVLAMSHGLQSTGAVDVLARHALPETGSPTLAIAALTALGALMSAFMNNVGAMAMLMPIAFQAADRHRLPPGKVLMPLSFGTILGGMTTLIGTPPNMIVSGFREGLDGAGFGMFDYTPVGIAVAVLGVSFAAVFGWRLVPARDKPAVDSFDTGRYLTEVCVREGGRAEGRTIRDLEAALAELDAQVIGMVRNEFRVFAPNQRRLLRAGDILVVEADPESLAKALSALGVTLADQDSDHPDRVADRDTEGLPADDAADARSRDGEVRLQEFVVMPNSALIGRTGASLRLRSLFGVSLLAISRQGRRTIQRLRSTRLRIGDVLLMQGPPEGLGACASHFGAAPLVERPIRIPRPRMALMATVIMVLAVAAPAAGLLTAPVSFALGALVFMLTGVLPRNTAYSAVDWPVIVLLAALIPVAGAMQTTGAADLVARTLLESVAGGHVLIALGVILVVAMTLSDFMNNAATAAVMCPIAIATASRIEANPDAFLMAVAIGASCAFLTPIGHQNNTLILGPGGLRFGDYWRLGLPMELLVLAVGIPMLTLVWAS